MSSTRKITLTSNDGESFEVDEAVAKQSEIIKFIIEDDCNDDNIPGPNLTGKILAKVVDYCKKHVEAEGGTDDDEVKNWDAEFVEVDESTLFKLIRAANYLNIKGLLDLTCQAMLDKIMTMVDEKTRAELPDELTNIFSRKISSALRREKD